MPGVPATPPYGDNSENGSLYLHCILFSQGVNTFDAILFEQFLAWLGSMMDGYNNSSC